MRPLISEIGFTMFNAFLCVPESILDKTMLAVRLRRRVQEGLGTLPKLMSVCFGHNASAETQRSSKEDAIMLTSLAVGEMSFIASGDDFVELPCLGARGACTALVSAATPSV